MRRLLLIAMIIMLPLRGLMGDAMAAQMLPTALQQAEHAFDSGAENATHLIADSAYSTRATDAFDHQKTAAITNAPCHDGTATADDDGDDGVVAKDACSTCQACHLSAFVSNSPLVMPMTIAEAKPASPAVQWVSAELSLLAKPPVF